MAPQKQAESTAAPEPAAPDSAAAVVEAPAPVPEVLPNNALTGDMLFRITKAELEFKQGQWQGAYITMLSLAQQTRDPRLARRAVAVARALQLQRRLHRDRTGRPGRRVIRGRAI